MGVEVSHIRQVIEYAWNTRRAFVILLIILLAILSFAYAVDYWASADQIGTYRTAWADHIEPLISFLTFVVAIAVWHGELRQDWIASLPKRLDVLFLYKGSPLMVCEHADLSSEADIRPLGQQIGLQLAGEQRLNFKAPSVRMKNKGVSKCSKYVDYAVIFELLPKVHLGEQDGANISPFDVLWCSGHCVVWRSPFNAVDFLKLESECLVSAEVAKEKWAAELRP